MLRAEQSHFTRWRVDGVRNSMDVTDSLVICPFPTQCTSFEASGLSSSETDYDSIRVMKLTNKVIYFMGDADGCTIVNTYSFRVRVHWNCMMESCCARHAESGDYQK